MSQEIARKMAAIKPQGDERWEDILVSVPVSIEVGDYSGCKKWIEGLREGGVEDLEAYFKENPHVVREGITYMAEGFLLYNYEFLNMYDSNSMEEFIGITEGIDPRTDRSIYTDDFVGSFEQMFLAFARGETRCGCFEHLAVVFHRDLTAWFITGKNNWFTNSRCAHPRYGDFGHYRVSSAISGMKFPHKRRVS